MNQILGIALMIVIFAVFIYFVLKIHKISLKGMDI